MHAAQSLASCQSHAYHVFSSLSLSSMHGRPCGRSPTRGGESLTLFRQVGTPLTHRHFLRRAMGTYGPGIKAGQGTFPGPKTPIPGAV